MHRHHPTLQWYKQWSRVYCWQLINGISTFLMRNPLHNLQGVLFSIQNQLLRIYQDNAMADFALFELGVVSSSVLEPIELGKILFWDCAPSENKEIIQNLFLKQFLKCFLMFRRCAVSKKYFPQFYWFQRTGGETPSSI